MKRVRGRDRARAVAHEYARLAPVYDARWASYLEATVELTLSYLPERAPRCVLDVGCGTGALLEPLAVRFPSARIAGVDPSREMLTVARAKLPEHVNLFAGRAEALPVPAERFDLVVSTSSLHYFSDCEAAADEMNRVLVPGGRVLITDWCGDFLTLKLFDLVARALGRANFTMLGTAELGSLLGDAGFEDIRPEPHRLGAFWGVMVASAGKAAAAG